MPREKLTDPSKIIRIVLTGEERRALDAYVKSRAEGSRVKITLSALVREAIAPLIAEGRKLLDRELGS